MNFSLYDRVTDVFIELYLELLCLMYLIQAGLGWLDSRPIPQVYAVGLQILDIIRFTVVSYFDDLAQGVDSQGLLSVKMATVYQVA